jgi:hypothetical protein
MQLTTCTSLIALNSTRLNMNLLLRISNATTTKMMTDVAWDFIKPSEEDTLEYEFLALRFAAMHPISIKREQL